MPKCSYCGKNYEFPKGITIVNSSSGRVSYFCSRKCRRYQEMKRKKGKWSEKNKD